MIGTGMGRGARRAWPVVAAGLWLSPEGALAQAAGAAQTDMWSRSALLGDAGGVRTALGDLGIAVTAQETSEVLGNVTGGVRQGADYDGLTQVSLQLDTGKAFGWQGGTFDASALQIHGRSLSADNLDDIQTASGIAAERATRLWELWYDQALPGGTADIKIGQQSLDTEFIGSQGASLFINTMMGWPVVPSFDLYAGGPAYPLSSLGVRVRAAVGGGVTVLAGVFDDNPPGGPFGDDDQLRGAERSGAAFDLRGGALAIGEIQYAVNQDAVNQGGAKPGGGLPGTYKLGGGYDTGRFPDQRLGADPDVSGEGPMHRGDWSVYATADQMLWRAGAESPRAVSVFARAMGAPGDRNFISFGLNAGVTMTAPVAARAHDTIGLGYGLAQVSAGRGNESFVELTYQAQVAGWWVVQPDLQYVFTPGGGVADPDAPSRRVGNALVLGVRTTVVF